MNHIECRYQPRLIHNANARRFTANMAFVLLIGVVALFVVKDVARPSLAAPAETAHSAMLVTTSSSTEIRPLDVVTHQVFLPLVFNNHPRQSIFGVQMYGALNASHGFTRAVESQSGWVRIPVLWSTIEPANTMPEKYIWTSLDDSVQALRNTDVAAIFTIESNPAWAAAKASGPVTDTADLLEFIGAVVARYPHIRYWEMYNEPDSTRSFGKKGAAYAALLQQVYPVIKTANPAAKIVLGGLALDYFEDQGGVVDRNFLPDVLTNCMGVCFDIANFHYYPFFRAQWESYGRDIIGKVNYVRQVLASRNFARPLIVTETGWPSASIWGSDELSARYVTKVFVRSLASALETTIWYALLDADTSNPGLLDSVTTPGSLIPRSSYTAYQTLSDLLTGSKYVATISATPPLEGYQFQVNGTRMDVYWVDCPSMIPTIGIPQDCGTIVSMFVSGSRVGMYNVYGTQTIVADGDDGLIDGRIRLNISTDPIYIDYNPE